MNDLSAPVRRDPRLAKANGNLQAPPAILRLDRLVSRQAGRRASHPAVITADATLDYATLEARANGVAAALLAAGVTPGALVGVCLTRQSWLLPALLGVLKAGAAYVPLDPDFPAERLAVMLEDAAPAAVLTEAATRERLAGHGVRELQVEGLQPATQAISVEVKGPALAYVIYTSGSTGRPKGVEVYQHSVCNVLESMARKPGFGPDDRMLALATVSFDMAVPEIWLPLVTGGTTVLLPRAQAADGAAIAHALAEHRITQMQATPTTCILLLQAGWQPAPGFKLLAGAEPLMPATRDQLLDTGVELWNMYGPTETTVWSTTARLDAKGGRVSIGRPMTNQTVWILDEALQPVPYGEQGEICIGGFGVARGYRGMAELTTEKFVADPYSPPVGKIGRRMYRTGDLGRWREDGELEHLGRKDNQVKVRGYRIELGEIDAVLAEHAGVRQAVTVVRPDKDGEPMLVAFLVAPEWRPGLAEVRSHLGGRLPVYMLPQQAHLLDELPFLPNGKIDRRRLESMELAPAAHAAGVADGLDTSGMSATEAALARIWADVLGIDFIDPEDRFFDLGGSSIKAQQVIVQVEKLHGVRLNGDMMLLESLAQHANRIDSQ